MTSTRKRKESASLKAPAPKREKPFRIGPEPEAEDAHKFEIGAPANTTGLSSELPERYGSNTLFLVARDPEWLFCYWDVDWRGLAPQLGSAAVILRLYASHGGMVQDAVVNPHAPNWYLPVPREGETYFAELGYTSFDGDWVSICRSGPAPVPVKDFALPAEESFATVPIDLSFQHLLGLVSQAMREGETLVQALGRLEKEKGQTEPEWSDDQRKVLEVLLGEEVVERIGLGSGEIERVLRKRMEQTLDSETASALHARPRKLAAPGLGESSLFSGVGASWSGQAAVPPPKTRDFFMHVNAEVIFYGGTHPDASVWIDGQQIPLRPDGTFRYHFIFPDGGYEIPIVAESPDGVEQRSARLVFKRNTAREGDVGSTAQPKGLSKPMGRK